MDNDLLSGMVLMYEDQYRWTFGRPPTELERTSYQKWITEQLPRMPRHVLDGVRAEVEAFRKERKAE